MKACAAPQPTSASGNRNVRVMKSQLVFIVLLYDGDATLTFE